MTGVFATFRSSRSRLTRLAGLILLIAQVVAVGIAPAAEALASHSAAAHVEDAGIHLHHSHNPNDCPACLALQIGATGLPSRVERPTPAVARVAPMRVAQAVAPPRARGIEPHAPRAPPLLLVASR
ncbi:MAG TPA: hypothetical protein VF102_09330 [Gemmatimonadaceae bacterium]